MVWGPLNLSLLQVGERDILHELVPLRRCLSSVLEPKITAWLSISFLLCMSKRERESGGEGDLHTEKRMTKKKETVSQLQVDDVPEWALHGGTHCDSFVMQTGGGQRERDLLPRRTQ